MALRRRGWRRTVLRCLAPRPQRSRLAPLLELVPVKILDDLQPRTTELAIVDFDRTGPSILPTPLRPGGHDNPVILVPNDGLVGFD
jgi:hypothetical protein